MTQARLPSQAIAILRLDGGAGFVVGLAVLCLRDWLVGFYGLAPSLLLVIGVANLAYGCYAGALAVMAGRRAPPPRGALDVLIVANFAWTATCVALLAVCWRDGGAFGLLHIALEGIVCATLATAERRVVRPHTR